MSKIKWLLWDIVYGVLLFIAIFCAIASIGLTVLSMIYGHQ